MKTLKAIKRERLANPDTRAAYDAQADEFAIARELIAARTCQRGRCSGIRCIKYGEVRKVSRNHPTNEAPG